MVKSLAIRSALFVGCLGVVGCRKPAPPGTDNRDSPNSAPHATIWIGQDGSIELNGQFSDLSAVDKALSDLEQRKGSVMYGRDAPSGDPHPNGMQVIKMVVSHRLPIRMSTRRDFSDAVGADGRAKQ
jgi:hypothetical protein